MFPSLRIVGPSLPPIAYSPSLLDVSASTSEKCPSANVSRIMKN